MKMSQTWYRIIKVSGLNVHGTGFGADSTHGETIRHEQYLQLIGQANHAILAGITFGFQKGVVVGQNDCRIVGGRCCWIVVVMARIVACRRRDIDRK